MCLSVCVFECVCVLVYVCLSVCVFECMCVCVSSFQVLNEWADFYETSYERYFSGENQNTTSVKLKMEIMM